MASAPAAGSPFSRHLRWTTPRLVRAHAQWPHPAPPRGARGPDGATLTGSARRPCAAAGRAGWLCHLIRHIGGRCRRLAGWLAGRGAGFLTDLGAWEQGPRGAIRGLPACFAFLEQRLTLPFVFKHHAGRFVCKRSCVTSQVSVLNVATPLPPPVQRSRPSTDNPLLFFLPLGASDSR